MVKKLFKHEAHAMWRSMAPIWCVLFGVSVLGRLIQLFEQDTVAYNIVGGSAVVFYTVSLVACVVFPFIFAIIRFYRNLFTGEGYLSFTLPVTNHQHISVKLAVAVITEVVTLVVAALSVVVMTFGDLTVEIGKVIGYLLKTWAKLWHGHMPMYLVEGFVDVIAVFAVETLLFYTCICIGQQSKKNRKLAAVGAYFGFYAIKQVIGTIIVLIVTEIDWLPLLKWIDLHRFATAHIVLCGFILVEVAIGCFLYWLSHRLITNRLNLE